MVLEGRALFLEDSVCVSRDYRGFFPGPETVQHGAAVQLPGIQAASLPQVREFLLKDEAIKPSERVLRTEQSERRAEQLLCLADGGVETGEQQLPDHGEGLLLDPDFPDQQELLLVLPLLQTQSLRRGKLLLPC